VSNVVFYIKPFNGGVSLQL